LKNRYAHHDPPKLHVKGRKELDDFASHAFLALQCNEELINLNKKK
jgi:hypothetical protein